MGDRESTSHERQAGRPWDDSYQHGPAPWDIGRAQGAIVRVSEAGGIVGPVLDAGTGTGENALHLASLGLSVVGVDVAETALDMARAKASERGLDAEFVAADALHLGQLNRAFATVIDSGLLHTFDVDERAQYTQSVASVLEPGGTFYVLCFSDEGSDIGPHPLSQDQLRAAFDEQWKVVAIVPERIETRFHDDGAPAWLATIRRV
ncbi:MAG: class I SAM-dependent methyltransferase [Nocardiaceae bacterium]|nr:class I SAM-dependent methyltransferase [Nocardiaceae bacterium]